MGGWGWCVWGRSGRLRCDSLFRGPAIAAGQSLPARFCPGRPSVFSPLWAHTMHDASDAPPQILLPALLRRRCPARAQPTARSCAGCCATSGCKRWWPRSTARPTASGCAAAGTCRPAAPAGAGSCLRQDVVWALLCCTSAWKEHYALRVATLPPCTASSRLPCAGAAASAAGSQLQRVCGQGEGPGCRFVRQAGWRCDLPGAQRPECSWLHTWGGC